MPHIHEKYDFTVSAYILHPSEPKLCLHFHKKFQKWMQVGGHVELDEDPLEALAHELAEETGLLEGDYEFIEPASQPPAAGYKKLPQPINMNVHAITDIHNHIDIVYYIKSRTERLQPQEGESQEVHWFNRTEIEKLQSTGTLINGCFDMCIWLFENTLR